MPKNDKDISWYKDNQYHFPSIESAKIEDRPIIIGLGPAGLFCAYMLAKYGFKPLIFERGKCVDERTSDVEKFWETGVLNVSSNVQFGEGGAGTFSDGKLNSYHLSSKDKDGNIYLGGNDGGYFKKYMSNDEIFDLLMQLR